MHKVENILLPDHIKIFCFGHQEKQEWWVIKTYHFCKHCNSLSPLGIFCLVYPFLSHILMYLCFEPVLAGAKLTVECLNKHSSMCHLQKFKIRDFFMSRTSGLRGFVHILSGEYNLGLLSFFPHFNVNHIFMLGEYGRPSKQPSIFWREFAVGTVVFTKL